MSDAPPEPLATPSRAALVTSAAIMLAALASLVAALWPRSPYTPPPAPDAGVFALERATVTLRSGDDGGALEACERTAGGTDAASRFQCRPESWAYVGPTTLPVGGQNELCIWAHPLPERTTVVSYPAVRLANGRGVRLHTALSDRAVGGGVPVEVVVRHGSAERRHIHADRRGWQQVDLPTSGEPAPLVLEISARNVGRRHFCYRLEEL